MSWASEEFGRAQRWKGPLAGGGSGGGGGDTSYGGLSAQDEEFKKYLYDKFKELPDEYEAYEGDRFTDRTPEELALMQEMQGGAMFDEAKKDLGFAGDVYKKGATYGARELDEEASALMEGDLYRNEVAEKIKRDMNRGASMSGMDLTGTQNFGGTGGGDRADLARLSSNLGYQRQAGEALTGLHFGALRDARSTARGLRSDRETSAGRFGNTALQNLGIGKDKYASQLGAFQEDRSYQDRDKAWDYKNWQDQMNYPWKKLSYASNMFSSMPIEEKVMTQQPASGGK